MDFVSIILIYIKEHWDFVLSILLSVLSFWYARYLWKNPISTEFITKSLVYKDKDHLKYKVGQDHKGWMVIRINWDSEGSLGLNITSRASKKNNPTIKVAPTELSELDKLKFDELE